MKQTPYLQSQQLRNIAYEESSISNVSELQTAVESLISKGVDALYTGNDNTIASAMATYTDAAYAKKVPILCSFKFSPITITTFCPSVIGSSRIS